ncbi:sodium-dependent transporter [uncultured Desulfobacter sp.]|uniref:sodium-dependent transporter n=1 Tax=uncultured Desulfobacter sp. TaxID=240139 RepID=UPI002AA84852|nr:sodium-dependent transporter [uncultured Desulfobacter sp.]
MRKREQWGTRTGFIFAAIGSAIGLGNIWRFPYVAYENGGGAFFIPYLFAMVTAGIPFLILEFGVGHKFKTSVPNIFSSLSGRMEWLGWWQLLVSFVISIYYVAVVGWTISYLILAFTQGWGQDTANFFYQTYLQISDTPFAFNGIRWPILGSILCAWLVSWVVLFSGVKKGIELAGKIFMPLLFIMVIVITARAVTLEGATEGLNWMFQPDFSALFNFKVWIEAYGQIFFSLSIGFAIMLTYASYLPKNSDMANNGFITAFCNCGFSILCGIMVFSVLGNMAFIQGVGVDKVVSSGVGLAFVTIPKAINSLPGPVFFGTLFFAALLFAGLSSMISICEVSVSVLIDRFGISRKAAASIYCGIGILCGIVFATHSGLLVLDIVDRFINNFGVLVGGLLEIVFLVWICGIDNFKDHINLTSDFKVGKLWTFCLKFITPAILGYMILSNLIGDIITPYGGYPSSALLIFGLFMVQGIIILSVMIHVTVNGGEK